MLIIPFADMIRGAPASAPNPKFAHVVLQKRLRTSGSKRGTRTIELLVSLLIPKFALEGAAKVCELRNRDTSWTVARSMKEA
jgi:hypothetical protein